VTETGELLTMKMTRTRIHCQVLYVVLLCGGFVPAMAIAQEGASRHVPAPEWETASKIVVRTTSISRGAMGETRRTSTTDIFHTDGRGRTRLDRGPWIMLWAATGSGPRVFDRRTGEPVPIIPFPADAPSGSAPHAAALGRILKQEDLGERRIADAVVRGTRIRYEMPDTIRDDAPLVELWTETWKSADGRVHEKTIWDRSRDQTHIMEYAYEPLTSVPEEMFELHTRTQ
jgi:hypothetical protein